jgi:hypothetical protein
MHKLSLLPFPGFAAAAASPAVAQSAPDQANAPDTPARSTGSIADGAIVVSLTAAF